MCALLADIRTNYVHNVGKPVSKDLRLAIMKRAIERDFDFEI